MTKFSGKITRIRELALKADIEHQFGMERSEIERNNSEDMPEWAEDKAAQMKNIVHRRWWSRRERWIFRNSAKKTLAIPQDLPSVVDRSLNPRIIGPRAAPNPGAEEFARNFREICAACPACTQLVILAKLTANSIIGETLLSGERTTDASCFRSRFREWTLKFYGAWTKYVESRTGNVRRAERSGRTESRGVSSRLRIPLDERETFAIAAVNEIALREINENHHPILLDYRWGRKKQKLYYSEKCCFHRLNRKRTYELLRDSQTHTPAVFAIFLHLSN